MTHPTAPVPPTAPPPAPAGGAHLLVVDDEPDLRTLYELTLLREGHRVDAAGSVGEARAALQARSFDLVITDMRLPDGLGLDLLADLAQRGRGERAIVVTAYGSAESAVEALKQGAFDYLTKPVDLKQFRTVVAAALQRGPAVMGANGNATTTPGSAAPGVARSASARPNAALAATPAGAAHQGLVGGSAALSAVRERVTRVAASMAPVLLLGESGTGKEVVARAIHASSHRASGPFVAVNCGAIPDNLIEAEFFGARKGAYTGATTDREGYFSAARGGTLFLDEIGDLPLAMQAKLLRVIQERRVRPLGGVQEEQVDVRILSATHRNLAKAVQDGGFRQDLYYRLAVIEIRLPPLRERRDDLDALTAALMQRICTDSGQTPVPLSDAARQWLHRHPFAGNVRELENLLHRALALCNGQEITPDDLTDPHGAQTTTDWPDPAATADPAGAAGAAAPAPAAASVPVPEGRPTVPPTDGAPPPALGALGAMRNDGGSAADNALHPPLPAAADAPTLDLQAHLDAQEKAILERMLRETRGNRTAAAARLGLNLRQIRYRIARLGIQVGEADDAPGDRADGGADTTADGAPNPGDA